MTKTTSRVGKKKFGASGIILPEGTPVYHGTAWSCDEYFIRPFKKIEAGAHDELNVAWVADREEIAEGFAREKKFESRESPSATAVVLAGVTKKDLRLFDLDNEKVCIHVDRLPHSEEELEEIGVTPDAEGNVCLSVDEYYEKDIFENINEIYGFIDDRQFDGAVKGDSDYNGRPYRDIALFRPGRDVEIKTAAFRGKVAPVDAAIAEFEAGCRKKRQA